MRSSSEATGSRGGAVAVRGIPPLLVGAAVVLLILADRAGSTPWRWVGAGAVTIALCVLLVAASAWLPVRIGAVMPMCITAASLLLLLWYVALILTGWPDGSPGARTWDRPAESVGGAALALAAVAIGVFVAIRAWRGRFSPARATAAVLSLSVVAAFGALYLTGSTTTSRLPEVELIPNAPAP